MGGNECITQGVQFFGRYARLDVSGDHIQRLGREATRGAHPCEILRRVDRDASCVGPAVHRALSPWVFLWLVIRQDAQPAALAQGQMVAGIGGSRYWHCAMMIEMYTDAGGRSGPVEVNCYAIVLVCG